MNEYTRLGSALLRIASATGALRARAEDVRRAEHNGADLRERIEAIVTRLEKDAAELEDALA